MWRACIGKSTCLQSLFKHFTEIPLHHFWYFEVNGYDSLNKHLDDSVFILVEIFVYLYDFFLGLLLENILFFCTAKSLLDFQLVVGFLTLFEAADFFLSLYSCVLNSLFPVLLRGLNRRYNWWGRERARRPN